jgi:hypothetical protein
MNSRKVLSSIQAAFLMLSVSLSVASTSLNIPESISTNDHRFTVDGGAPVPPYPQPPVIDRAKIFVADGGAPVPPYPQPPVIDNAKIFVADGGAPVPPYPQPPIANSTNILITDVGAAYL